MRILALVEQYDILTLVLLVIVANFLSSLVLYLFFKRFVLNKYDPFYITLFLVLSPATAGYLLTIFLFNITISSLIILFFLVSFLFVVFLFPIKNISLQDHVPKDFQLILLIMSILILILDIVFNMILPGKIPLLSSSGVAGRFDATENSRLLTWLSMSISSLPIFIFSFSRFSSIRKVALIAIAISMLKNILFASKSVLILPAILILLVICVSKAQGNHYRYTKYKRYLLFTLVAIIFISPVYFYMIGFSSSSTSSNIVLFRIAYRLFYGFDQLIPASFLNLASNPLPDSNSVNMNLLEYQLLPFVKTIFNLDIKFSSIGQYIVYVINGDYIDKAYTFPNSNLILETIMTSGYILGYVFFVIELVIVFYLRNLLFSKPISSLSLGIVFCLINNPIGIFMSGQEWINKLVISIFVVFFCYFIYWFLREASKKQT